ncbi:unnamed protein product [Brachionus calyciflorus]|uniref:GH18 domain-containing protein n=1 Tax=Brachionus calyciflorus TaxID=104777 RepID=A0A813XX68_9BILA|nr:unnamed protein product [Brachionus calyciflorus]
MAKQNYQLALITLFLSIIFKARCYVYMCWYVNWSELRPIRPFSADQIDYDLCTHILYSAAVIDPKTLTIAFMQQNVSENLEKILNSKIKYKNLKIILTIGSYDTKSYGFESVTNPNDTQAMLNFSNNLVAYLRKFNFDGVLLDYEFPGMVNRAPLFTKEGFSLLIRKLKRKFKEESIISEKTELILMSTMAARVDWINKFYEIDKIISYLDYMLLLTYDLKRSSEKRTRITSALFPKANETGIYSTFNIASVVAKYLTEGAKANKMVIGIPAYGRSYELTDSLDNMPGALAKGPGLPGLITDETGVLSYFEICDKAQKNDSKKFWDESNLGPYLVYDEKYWIGYEDMDSVYEKMLFIKANNLSGAFLWSIDLDDFDGKHCSQGKYPLLKAIRSELTFNDYETNDFLINSITHFTCSQGRVVQCLQKELYKPHDKD